VFGPILESSRLPLTIPWALHGSGVNGAQVGSWRGYYSPLHWPTVHSRLSRGQGLPVRHRLVLSQCLSAVFVRGNEAS
jgi:hypothetical protein